MLSQHKKRVNKVFSKVANGKKNNGLSKETIQRACARYWLGHLPSSCKRKLSYHTEIGEFRIELKWYSSLDLRCVKDKHTIMLCVKVAAYVQLFNFLVRLLCNVPRLQNLWKQSNTMCHIEWRRNFTLWMSHNCFKNQNVKKKHFGNATAVQFSPPRAVLGAIFKMRL